jgi:predicted metal-dependent phosphoesterase TrpH
MAIDLHVHTTASDGTLSPAAVVQYAETRGLEAIAVTDHDTVEGLDEAVAEGSTAGFEVVPGVEISADYPGAALHVLGYYLDYKNSALLKRLAVLQHARAERNPKIVRKLQALGFAISFAEVEQEAGSGLVGRPHFAQVMLKKGYVKSMQEAFDKYLKKGAAAYEEKFRFPVREAISMIANAGGIPVLGHPVTLNCNGAQLEANIKAWKESGLQGIEVYYSDHDAALTNQYAALARSYGLIPTGGSDFHGSMIKGIELGIGKGNLHIPYSVLQELKQKKFQ